jgi:drug/metabolite transporter (DMT)-like permease
VKQVGLEHIIIFIGCVIAVLWGISIYLMKTGKMTTKEWLKRSLGIPSGSVRALLAFLILFLILYMVINDIKLTEDLPEWVIGILGAVIGFYFGASTAKGLERTTDSSTESESAQPTDKKK